MSHKNTNRRDANEAELVAIWKQTGCFLEQMGRDAGFDWLVGFHGELFIVEIKNPAVKWKLTEAEKQMRDELEQNGIEYHIITNLKEAGTLIGIILQE